MQKREKISRILIWAPFKDIAFSLLFLRCCLSFLSFLFSLSRAWTPAAETRLGSDQQERQQWWTFGYKRWRWATFLPPEDVRSGFTDSAFSLLDDLDLLPFSFSAESGESEEGLALFLKESGKRVLQFSTVWWCTEEWLVLMRRQTYWFHFHPFYAWVLGSSHDHWQNDPERKRGEKTVLELLQRCSERWRLIKPTREQGRWRLEILNTNSLPVFTILFFLLLFGSALHAISVFLLHLLLSALRPGYRVVGDMLLQTQAYINTREHRHQFLTSERDVQNVANIQATKLTFWWLPQLLLPFLFHKMVPSFLATLTCRIDSVWWELLP